MRIKQNMQIIHTVYDTSKSMGKHAIVQITTVQSIRDVRISESPIIRVILYSFWTTKYSLELRTNLTQRSAIMITTLLRIIGSLDTSSSRANAATHFLATSSCCKHNLPAQQKVFFLITNTFIMMTSLRIHARGRWMYTLHWGQYMVAHGNVLMS